MSPDLATWAARQAAQAPPIRPEVRDRIVVLLRPSAPRPATVPRR